MFGIKNLKKIAELENNIKALENKFNIYVFEKENPSKYKVADKVGELLIISTRISYSVFSNGDIAYYYWFYEVLNLKTNTKCVINEQNLLKSLKAKKCSKKLSK